MKRRTFIRTAGAVLALPALESLGEVIEPADGSARPRRFLCISTSLGFYPSAVFPDAGGAEYGMTRTLGPLAPLRDRFTLFGGTAHHPVLSGHPNEPAVFTGYSAPDSIRKGRFPISLDQIAAEQFGRRTQHRNLVLAASPDISTATSFYRGLPVYPIIDPRRVFDRLFGVVDAGEARAEIAVRRGVLDLTLAQAKDLAAHANAADRRTLDAYFTSIREAELQLDKQAGWIDKAAPHADAAFLDADDPAAGYTPDAMLTRLRLMLDLIHLAFRHDLTRVATLHIRGIGGNHHGLTHHLGRPATIESLIERDVQTVGEFARLLTKFDATDMGGRSLMDDTLTVLTTALGDANAHSGENLPSIVAGGGLKHRGFRPMPGVNQCDLYLGLLHRLGIERESFATSSGAVDL